MEEAVAESATGKRALKIEKAAREKEVKETKEELDRVRREADERVAAEAKLAAERKALEAAAAAAKHVSVVVSTPSPPVLEPIVQMETLKDNIKLIRENIKNDRETHSDSFNKATSEMKYNISEL